MEPAREVAGQHATWNGNSSRGAAGANTRIIFNFEKGAYQEDARAFEKNAKVLLKFCGNFTEIAREI